MALLHKPHVPESKLAHLLAVATIMLSACLGNIGDSPDDGISLAPANDSGTDGSPADLAGVPCDVAVLIETNCLGCHINTAPALGSLDALTAMASSDPSRTVAAIALDAMRGIGAAMPPSGTALSEAEIAPFADWVAAGMPAGDCGAADPGPNPFDVAPVCSTGLFWTSGDDGSREMHPGQACINCHDSESEGPNYVIAGTVFATGHEPDDCYGSDGDLQGASVHVTDANGQQISLPVRDAGNFYLEDGTVVFPISVKVVYGGKEIAMPSLLQAGQGDCNSCHSQYGTDEAPGRIILPP
jgi:cytochrome c553